MPLVIEAANLIQYIFDFAYAAEMPAYVVNFGRNKAARLHVIILVPGAPICLAPILDILVRPIIFAIALLKVPSFCAFNVC
ncbi:MAG: hypothetical protein SO111_00375, partial [Collinsella sp.]|nr:hypothetical protein [Collinsella sp.]